MLDRDQVAERLQIRRRDFVRTIEARPPMPTPCGYYRGRVLWDEIEIDGWIADHLAAASPGGAGVRRR